MRAVTIALVSLAVAAGALAAPDSGTPADGWEAAVIAPDGHALLVWNAGAETDPDSSRVWVRSRPGRTGR